MRVLVTGGTGFLGGHLINCLLKHGISTIVAGRTPPQGSTNVEFIHADLLGLTDFGRLVEEARATHLLHMAWYTEHGKYWTAPVNLRWVDATVRLVEAFCLAGGNRVVVAGTCAEYDWTHGYCVEDKTPLNPATLYGVAKNAARQLTLAICSQQSVPCAWGRIFLPYGPGEDQRRLIPSLTAVFQGKRQPFGINSSAYRDFLHATDVAEAFITLLQSEATGAYNICSGRPVLIEDLVRQIASSVGVDPNPVLELASERPGDPAFLVGDNQKLKALGWSPQYSLADTFTAGDR